MRLNLPDAQLVALYNSGQSASAIGEQFGVSRNAVDKRLKLAGVTMRDRNTPRLPAERSRLFWVKVDKNGPVPEHSPELGPCWVWRGPTNHNGYGILFHELAHRWAYEERFGPLTEDKPNVLHHCDNPACVNSESHLYAGTQLDNVRDAYNRKRFEHRKPEDWVPVAEERARKNGGLLESYAWLVDNKMSGLAQAVMNHPKLFAHIKQTKLVGGHVGGHNRWHVQRGRKNPNCNLCRPKRLRREAGVVLLIEALIVAIILCILATMAIISFVSLRRIQNQMQARQQVFNTARAVIEAQLCIQQNAIQNGTCAANPAVNALVPSPGTIKTLGYNFTFVGGTSWSYVATPVAVGTSGTYAYGMWSDGILRCGAGGTVTQANGAC